MCVQGVWIISQFYVSWITAIWRPAVWFQKGRGCSHAIYTLRGIVSHINTNGSTAVLCALDISKAFDKMSHTALYIKLMQRNIPKCLLDVSINWYSKSYAFVRWGSFVSRVFQISAGVRQGGVLSPALFAVFMDSMICKLRAAGYGANIFVNQWFFSPLYCFPLSPWLCKVPLQR